MRGQQDPREQLLNYLRDRGILLLLDNFEHLLVGQGMGPIVDILGAAPEANALATSREVPNPQEDLYTPM